MNFDPSAYLGTDFGAGVCLSIVPLVQVPCVYTLV